MKGKISKKENPSVSAPASGKSHKKIELKIPELDKKGNVSLRVF